MAKKLQRKFWCRAFITEDKGAGWMAHIIISGPEDNVIHQEWTAWKNASAAKKWLKEQVKVHTPRKSVKLVAGPNLNEKGKPVLFVGELDYKIDSVPYAPDGLK